MVVEGFGRIAVSCPAPQRRSAPPLEATTTRRRPSRPRKPSGGTAGLEAGTTQKVGPPGGRSSSCLSASDTTRQHRPGVLAVAARLEPLACGGTPHPADTSRQPGESYARVRLSGPGKPRTSGHAPSRPSPRQMHCDYNPLLLPAAWRVTGWCEFSEALCDRPPPSGQGRSTSCGARHKARQEV